MKSRQASADGTSREPLTASRAPGATRAAASASPGRSRVLEGMQAPVGALTAEQLAFDDRDPQTARSERRGTVLPGRPRPQDEDVVALRHDCAASSADDASWYASSGLLPCWRATT